MRVEEMAPMPHAGSAVFSPRSRSGSVLGGGGGGSGGGGSGGGGSGAPIDAAVMASVRQVVTDALRAAPAGMRVDDVQALGDPHIVQQVGSAASHCHCRRRRAGLGADTQFLCGTHTAGPLVAPFCTLGCCARARGACAQAAPCVCE
jgi:hypothetical protein